MTRTKLDDRELPKYSKGEEIFNMVSHMAGVVLGVIAIIFSCIIGVRHNNIYGIVSGIIFGAMLILLYTMSSIYHGLNPNLKAKKVFQIIDHCSIFLLIAGSYVPFALCTLREYNVITGWGIFGFVWALAIVGIILNSVDLKKYKTFSMICYLAMGWCMMVRINVIFQQLGMAGFTLLLSGGIAYTVGAILYGVGKKHKWMHSIFHIACIIGSLLHMFCILFYVI